nr:hypothetical protein [Tanacetum cinerariifolium]
MAFVSSPSPKSTNEVPADFGVSTASPQKTGKKITINGSDTAGYDKSKVECFNYHKMGHFERECRDILGLSGLTELTGFRPILVNNAFETVLAK